MQNTITYHNNLLIHLNKWLYKLNNKLLIRNDNKLIKKYVFEYPMFSDIFYLDKSKQYSLPFYNIELLKIMINTLRKNELLKIKQNCEKNIEVLTYDILSLLNIYKHFIENSMAIKYINTHNNFNNKLYIYEIYLNTYHIWLKNYFSVLDIISNK